MLVLAIALVAASTVDVPAPLKPWVPWVLHGSEHDLCPLRTDNTRVCETPGSLQLDVEGPGASFTQTWRAWADTQARLPGDAKRWPLNVEIDGQPAIVVADGSGAPTVALSAGEHVVKGRFAWDALPESLAIPPATAAVRLTILGKEAAFVDRGDDGGRVWLQRERALEEREQDRLDVTAFRKVIDGVPLLVETQVLLEVSGKGREVSLPGALLEGFLPVALDSALPARVDGASLKVQVRPGRHALTFVQRRDADDRVMKAPKPGMGGVASDASPEQGGEEVWVFQADHAVRVATLEGPPSIVPEQTRLPDAWRSLPAYRVLPGDVVTLVQQRRGDESPAPSQLTLQRTLWLDFDGGGYTVHDDISGRFTGDRLSMGKGTTLGRVSTGDGPGDAFITGFTGEAGATTGVEVRSPSLRVSADSRIEGEASSLPAVSWAHDFQSVAATLHLPPGWRLAHATGVPVVRSTWVSSWTLFELFLVVIITVAMGRLWGPLVGGAALLTMVLTFQEDGAPRGLWLLVVALAALHRVLPVAWETKGVAVVLKWLRVGAAVVVALVSLAFAVQQVRVGMYPVLEQPGRRVGEGDTWGRAQYGGKLDDASIVALAANQDVAPEAPPVTKMMADEDSRERSRGEPQQQQQEFAQGIGGLRGSLGSSTSESLTLDGAYAGKVQQKKQRLLQIDPGSVVQTGPGLPQWGFTTVSMRFTGPVAADDTISLLLLSPRVNLLLAFLRVALVAFLVVVAFGFPGSRWPTRLAKSFRGRGALFTGAALVIAALGAHASPAHASDAVDAAAAPAPAVLDELKRRLLANPACSPACASISSVALDASSDSLRMRFEVHALAQTVVPLPGADKQWSASTIVVDGKPHAGAMRDGATLWLALSPGRHDVTLEGPLPRRDTVQLALPMPPHRASFVSSSWTLDGVHEDGVPDANLQLSRVAKGSASDGASEGGARDGSDGASVLPAFVGVERSLILGLSFEVETRVVRLSPTGSAVVLEVPLLPGESVTTDGVRVESGKALVSLGPNDLEAQWSGVLPTADKLVLEARKAPAGAPAFVETWSLEASPVWHVEESGIPPLHDETPRSGGARGWRPWPGEQLTLAITRPAGVAGQTITIEKTSQHVRPGVTTTAVTLTLVMRASRGGEHTVTLPEGATLLGATIEGRAQPLRPAASADGKTSQVRVPIVPGKQTVVLDVRVPRGVSLAFATPTFDGGGRSVNAEILLDVPDDRWVLFAWGPRAGPAVLFWSFFVILLLTGVALSRVPSSPLKAHQWVLLGLGLTQVPLVVAALVAGWLLALGWRKKRAPAHAGLFNLSQLGLAFWTCVALVGLVMSIHEGLLGAPDMQIAGNGSTQERLRWFADHASVLPVGHVINAPIFAYRLAMLAWALWLAFSLLGWLRFGWSAFSEGGMWRAIPVAPRPMRKPATTTEAPPGAPTSAAVPSTSPVGSATAAAPNAPAASVTSGDEKP